MKPYHLALFTITLFFITISAVYAAGDMGMIPCEGVGCRACDFVSLGNNILNWFVLIMAGIIALMFAFGGFTLLMSGGNSGKVTEGKEMMSNAVIGLVIVLSSWLIVNTIFKYMVGGNFRGKWYEIVCVPNPSLIADPKAKAVVTGGSPTNSSGTVQGRGGSNSITDAATQMINGTCEYSQTQRNNCTGNPGYTDCSQFSQQAFIQSGCKDPGSNTAIQYSNANTITSQSSLKGGDIIVYRNGTEGHSAICANDGCTQMMDAGGSKSGLDTRNSSWMFNPSLGTKTISCN